VVQKKTQKIKEKINIETLERKKYKHSYKSKHNGLQSYTYLNILYSTVPANHGSDGLDGADGVRDARQY